MGTKGTTLWPPVIALLTLCTTGCIVPPMSSGQDARILEKGVSRCTPYASSVRQSEDSEEVSKTFGVLVGTGTGNNTEFQVRLEHFQLDRDEGYNFISLGPKFGTDGGHFAFLFPVGLYWSGGVTSLAMLEVHPGVILTLPISDYFELNTAGKFIFPLNESSRWNVVNLGAGASTDFGRWALLPEVSLAWDVSNGGDPLVGYGIAVAFFK